MLDMVSELQIKANKLTHKALKQISMALSDANVGIVFDILQNIFRDDTGDSKIETGEAAGGKALVPTNQFSSKKS